MLPLLLQDGLITDCRHIRLRQENVVHLHRRAAIQRADSGDTHGTSRLRGATRRCQEIAFFRFERKNLRAVSRVLRRVAPKCIRVIWRNLRYDLRSTHLQDAGIKIAIIS